MIIASCTRERVGLWLLNLWGVQSELVGVGYGEKIIMMINGCDWLWVWFTAVIVGLNGWFIISGCGLQWSMQNELTIIRCVFWSLDNVVPANESFCENYFTRASITLKGCGGDDTVTKGYPMWSLPMPTSLATCLIGVCHHLVRGTGQLHYILRERETV